MFVISTMSSNNLTKSAYEKDQNDNNKCKKHATRDKDNYRSVCPSKLSKRELEDIYYSLQENNLELKRTINAQIEKNRILSTKVQRMTTQTKTYTGKGCCAAAKAIINEQKAGISDLTRANEALADRIRKLSTQLCTAKQFLNQNPSNRSCYKCFANTNNSIKILSTTSLHSKPIAANLKSSTASATQIEPEMPSARTAATNTLENEADNLEKKECQEVCSENRCRTIVEQFKQKIEELEEELAKTHTEYSTRMTQLESQVSALQAAAVRARSEQNLHVVRDSLELARRRRNVEAEKAELETQLSIEKSKVAELEMRLKAAELSQTVAKTIENHLSSAYKLEEKQLRQTSVERCSNCSNMVAGDTSPRLLPTNSSTKAPNELTVPDDKPSKSDDSGYADHGGESRTDDGKNDKTNQELMKKIEEMQSQLDALKCIKAETDVAKQKSSPYSNTFNDYKYDDEKEFPHPKVSPKQTGISISEPEAIAPKNLITETEITKSTMPSNEKENAFEVIIPTKDNEYSYNDGGNGSVSNKTNRRNETNEQPQQDNIPQGQAAKTDCSDKCDCPDDNEDLKPDTTTQINYESSEYPEKNASRMIFKEDQVILNSAKEFQHGDNNSSSLVQGEVEIVKPKAVNYYDKSNPEIQTDNIQQDVTFNRNQSIVRTQKPNTAKNDNFQQIPGPIPLTSESPNKRRVSLTKKKVKIPESKKRIESAKEQSKDGKSKIFSSNSKKNKVLLEKQDHKHMKDTRTTVQPDGRSGNKVTESIHKSDGYVNEKLLLDDTVYINSVKWLNKHGSILKPVGSSTPKADRSPPLSPYTYTVESRKSRSDSPANTEHEISVMTDLPSEKEEISDRLSPGEYRTTNTSTEMSPSRQGYTLSEGEVPVNQERRASKSLGEIRRNDYAKDDISFGEQKSPTEKMEATLQVISQELARCRSLLQTQRPRERKQNEAATGSVNPISLVLRKTEGKSHFDGTIAPSCLFTMHIVNVVLSDEALLRSRDARLVLKWQFDHKTTMTPLGKGRVTRFDFSTQYELQMTKDVEEYLKNEDMLITICEMDIAKKPFATCALPLRQALLNINKRVDMSLPLRAGPHLKEMSSGVLKVEDDIGVLDVWCMLLCK